MKMMKKLLGYVGRSWAKDPKDVPVIQIQQGSGVHTYFTVDANQLHFHSVPYQDNLPVKQSITLESMAIMELIATIQGMGYTAEVTNEALDTGLSTRKSFTLQPQLNVSILTSGSLTTFSSKLWEMLYPIARLLQDTDNDMGLAIQQMYVTATKGYWLDYWASFFNVKRESGESDALVSRRIMMTLVNLKTNNVAIEQLIKFAIKADAKVSDYAPSTFKVEVSADYMGQTATLDTLIKSIKGAGIDYFYHYHRLFEDSYPVYITDKTGIPAVQADATPNMELAGLNEAQFGWQVTEPDPFMLNADDLNSNKRLGLVYMLNDTYAIVGTLDNFEPAFVTYEELNVMQATSNVEELYDGFIEDAPEYLVGGLLEVPYGYEQLVLDPENPAHSGELFGSYLLNDEITPSMASEDDETYDRIQEELDSILHTYTMDEQFSGYTEYSSTDYTALMSDIQYLYKDTSFTLNSSDTNGLDAVMEARTVDGGNMTLYNSDMTISKTLSF